MGIAFFNGFLYNLEKYFIKNMRFDRSLVGPIRDLFWGKVEKISGEWPFKKIQNKLELIVSKIMEAWEYALHLLEESY